MKIILLALLLLGCSRETPSPSEGVVESRYYDQEADRYFIAVEIEVTAEEFRVIDVGDEWLALD